MSSTVTIDFKLADIKLESFDAYLLKLGGKNLSWDFDVIYIFVKCDFKYMPISQKFLNQQENKAHFLKVPSLSITDAKNHRNRLNCSF